VKDIIDGHKESRTLRQAAKKEKDSIAGLEGK
jgi:hypothetical protein